MDNASTKDSRAADIAGFLTFDMKLEIVVALLHKSGLKTKAVL